MATAEEALRIRAEVQADEMEAQRRTAVGYGSGPLYDIIFQHHFEQVIAERLKRGQR